MKTVLARGTAGIALIASLMGTAHASEGSANATEADKVESHAPANDKDDDGDESEASVPNALLDAFEAIDGTTSLRFPAEGAKEYAADGVVTLRSIDPFYGDINPFYGDINPFYGDIDAFWGHINPFYGDIDAFWGDINPFYGDIDAFWGDIDAFYGDIVAFDASKLNELGDFWNAHNSQIQEVERLFNEISYSATGDIVRDGTPDRVMGALATLISQGEAQFGAAYTAKTGNSFDALVDEVFARHGVDPNNKATVEILTARQRAALYLDWHDTLNLYSGVDAVDHWMSAINWTPSITQIQGNGRDTIIGIIDGSFSADTDLTNNIIWAGGYDNRVGGHGAGVASLIAGAHDGSGVMGIAPDVKIATYNPFNPNGASGWSGVADGILAMQPSGMQGANQFGVTSIINMSLGEKGWVVTQGLADIFARGDIQKVSRDTIYVIASGNEGITQTTDVEWYYGKDQATTIFVGSVNPIAEISSFSNRPGDTCLLNNGVCDAGNELYMRTVVAPGELLLMSDGLGGVMRHSGTSFAAPLVSGAIALLHDRWPWLAKEPEASAQIIFRSARDLGAPGPDQIYGWGLLDVEASQSPLDFNAMSFNMYLGGADNAASSNSYSYSASQLLTLGIPSYWETFGAFFTGFEDIDDTYRDFSIPVSSATTGRSTNALGRGQERFQDYVTQRFVNWINSGGTDSDGNGTAGFTELRSNAGQISGEWTLRYDGMAPRYTQRGELRMVHGAATLTDPKGQMSFTFGHGQGAMALSGYRFGILSDHDPLTGGVNPVLGFASGQSFAQAGYQLGSNTTIKLGYSENRAQWDDIASNDPQEILRQREFGDRPARAMTLDIEQRVGNDVSVAVQYTVLDEDNALLGTQTAVDGFLDSGAQTEAVTVSASLNIGSGFSFDVSATGARTQTARDQLFTSASPVISTAGQFSATKRGIFSDKDTLRVTVAQPLQIERGEIEFTSEQVIDRLTGERGPVTQTFEIQTERRISTEAVYATPLTRSSEFGVFGRYVSSGDFADEAGLVVGGNFSIRF